MHSDPLNPAPAERDVWSVSRLNLEVQGLLEGSFPLLWVEGEISNFSRPASGHFYFSLKDDRAQVNAAMFRARNQRLRFQPRNGLHVLVRARVTLYTPRGGFQLVVEHMEEAGEGRLRREFEALRDRLHREGLFDASRKRALPAHPRQVGVITSASGAALRDVLQVLRRRAPHLPVIIYPAAVQGTDAPRQLRMALALANRRRECDVLLLTRGGGSLEDLWAFNDEQLARDVAASAIPVVSAVGHEIDVALTDFAADVRAPTPSAAAELVSPDSGNLVERLAETHRRLTACMQRHLERDRRRLDALARRIRSPLMQLQQTAQRLDELEARAGRLVQARLAANARQLAQLERRLANRDPRHELALARQRLAGLERRLGRILPRELALGQQKVAALAQRLHVASPLATIERGYSVTLRDGQALRSVATVQPGDEIETRLADGRVWSQVTRIE